MYYPYLRAKQYELKALREFSVEHKEQNSIVPILEPVKQYAICLIYRLVQKLTTNRFCQLIFS